MNSSPSEDPFLTRGSTTTPATAAPSNASPSSSATPLPHADSSTSIASASGGGAAKGQSIEPLSCVSCRARKLKCDRVSPTCGRCARVNQGCVYPESRRKPTFKKRNVKELEARLAQVEHFLKDAAQKKTSKNGGGKEPPDTVTDVQDGTGQGSGISPASEESSSDNQQEQQQQRQEQQQPDYEFGFGDDMDGMYVDFTRGMGMNGNGGNFNPPGPGHISSTGGGSTGTDGMLPTMPGDLISLGLYESLPPQEMVEELNKNFFQRSHNYIPIIHPASYLRSFYSPPHMQPPMCLQYAIWAMASNGHEKYHQTHHDVFYARARQYAEADEMRGYGEHFITVQHAQAWALIATDEARSMLFTRAAMSSARCTKLVHMMGLHRLDCDADDAPPTLAPPRTWVELEERRRTLWGSFCIDSHGSIATGWPTMHDYSEITTHLPSSEEAFQSGEAYQSCTLQDALRGGGFQYGTFAGAALMCHIFNQILAHVYRKRAAPPRAGAVGDKRAGGGGSGKDGVEDVEYGEFWKRHRELDRMISSAFMLLPDAFRLPRNLNNPAAVHTNLNLHASIICLHHAALERIEKYQLPTEMREMSLTRMRTAAGEIIHIMTLTSHQTPGYKSPLVALSLYCAASVHIFEAKETFYPKNHPTSSTTTTPSPSTSSPSPKPQYDFSPLTFLLTAMEAIGRDHIITRSFLRQAILDIERNNLLGPAQAGGLKLPRGPCGLHISSLLQSSPCPIVNTSGGSQSSSSAPTFTYANASSSSYPVTPDKHVPGGCGTIPLLARSSVSKHTSIQPPLPGRLPLGAPVGQKPPEHNLGIGGGPCPLHRDFLLPGPPFENGDSISSGDRGNCTTCNNHNGNDALNTTITGVDVTNNTNRSELLANSSGAGNESSTDTSRNKNKRRRINSGPTSPVLIQDIMTDPPPPPGLSRIEHLFRSSAAASPSRITPLSYPPPAQEAGTGRHQEKASVCFPPVASGIRAAATASDVRGSGGRGILLGGRGDGTIRSTSPFTGQGRAGQAGGSGQRGGPGGRQPGAGQPGREGSGGGGGNCGHQHQTSHILAGPTPLPFRRAMAPLMEGECRRFIAPSQSNRGASRTTEQQQQSQQQQQNQQHVRSWFPGSQNSGVGHSHLPSQSQSQPEHTMGPRPQDTIMPEDSNPFGIIAGGGSGVDVDALLGGLGQAGIMIEEVNNSGMDRGRGGGTGWVGTGAGSMGQTSQSGGSAGGGMFVSMGNTPTNMMAAVHGMGVGGGSTGTGSSSGRAATVEDSTESDPWGLMQEDGIMWDGTGLGDMGGTS